MFLFLQNVFVSSNIMYLQLQPEVEHTGERFIAANGTRSTAAGRTHVQIDLGGVTLAVSFVVVRDLTNPALLGMDILQKVRAIIECGSGDLVVGGPEKCNTATCTVRKSSLLCSQVRDIQQQQA